MYLMRRDRLFTQTKNLIMKMKQQVVSILVLVLLFLIASTNLHSQESHVVGTYTVTHSAQKMSFNPITYEISVKEYVQELVYDVVLERELTSVMHKAKITKSLPSTLPHGLISETLRQSWNSQRRLTGMTFTTLFAKQTSKITNFL